jgi:hypothetical protein
MTIPASGGAVKLFVQTVDALGDEVGGTSGGVRVQF